jgi:hypothetical protein
MFPYLSGSKVHIIQSGKRSSGSRAIHRAILVLLAHGVLTSCSNEATVKTQEEESALNHAENNQQMELQAKTYATSEVVDCGNAASNQALGLVPYPTQRFESQSRIDACTPKAFQRCYEGKPQNQEGLPEIDFDEICPPTPQPSVTAIPAPKISELPKPAAQVEESMYVGRCIEAVGDQFTVGGKSCVVKSQTQAIDPSFGQMMCRQVLECSYPQPKVSASPMPASAPVPSQSGVIDSGTIGEEGEYEDGRPIDSGLHIRPTFEPKPDPDYSLEGYQGDTSQVAFGRLGSEDMISD